METKNKKELLKKIDKLIYKNQFLKNFESKKYNSLENYYASEGLGNGIVEVEQAAISLIEKNVEALTVDEIIYILNNLEISGSKHNGINEWKAVDNKIGEIEFGPIFDSGETPIFKKGV